MVRLLSPITSSYVNGTISPIRTLILELLRLVIIVSFGLIKYTKKHKLGLGFYLHKNKDSCSNLMVFRNFSANVNLKNKHFIIIFLKNIFVDIHNKIIIRNVLWI